MIKTKRIYQEPESGDGFRILVDGLWPRGVKKERAQVHLWLNDFAPSTNLRKWFNHDPDRWEEFKTHYFREIERHKIGIDILFTLLEQDDVTLLYSASDTRFNSAEALKEFITLKTRQLLKV